MRWRKCGAAAVANCATPTIRPRRDLECKWLRAAAGWGTFLADIDEIFVRAGLLTHYDIQETRFGVINCLRDSARGRQWRPRRVRRRHRRGNSTRMRRSSASTGSAIFRFLFQERELPGAVSKDQPVGIRPKGGPQVRSCDSCVALVFAGEETAALPYCRL